MTPVFLLRLDRQTEAGFVDVLVAFQASSEPDARTLAVALEEHINQQLAPDELILLVRGPAVGAARDLMLGSRELRNVRDRMSGRTAVTVLGYDARATEVSREPLEPGGRRSGMPLPELLRRGVTAIFAERRGFVEASASYHFANPSGRHTDRFIRLSNILVRQAEIAFVALSVMRLFPAGARQAYIDTPALYSVVAAISEQWRTLAPDRSPLAADSFGSYGGARTYPFTDMDRSVALISASSSGSMAGLLVERGFPADRLLHVLFLGKADRDLLTATDLTLHAKANPAGFTADRETYTAGSCKLCRQGSLPISLKGDQFDIAGPQPAALIVTRTQTHRKLQELMDRVVGLRALAVSTGPRQMRIRTAELIAGESGYSRRLDYFIRRHVPAGVEHVVLADEASRPFAERVAKVTGNPVPPVMRDRVDGIGGGGSGAAVLVVAAAIGSGRVLLDVSRDLRNVAPDAPIVYLVGFATPESGARLDTLRRNLVQTDHPVHHSAEFVEQLALPTSADPNAWQQEREFLDTSQDLWPDAATKLLGSRRDRLALDAEPLVDDLFVANDVAGALPLRKGFVFWSSDLPGDITRPGTPADVFFTVSAVLQQLRTASPAAGEQALRNNWLQQTLLSPENFGRFNDGVIQASILRAARPAELDYRDDAQASRDAARIARRIVESAGQPRGEAAAEFLIAIGSGRLRLCPRDEELVLAPATGAPAMVQALLELCRRTSPRRRQDAAARPKRRRRPPASKLASTGEQAAGAGAPSPQEAAGGSDVSASSDPR